MQRVLTVFCVVACIFGFAPAKIKYGKVDAKYTAYVTQAQWDALERLKSQARNVQTAWNEFNGTPTVLIGKLTSEGYRDNFSSPAEAAIQFLNDQKLLFRLDSPADEFKSISVSHDEIGMVHVKFNQVFQGISIYGSQLIVHFANDGSIASVNGRIVPTPHSTITSSLDESEAKSIASTHLKQLPATSSEKVFYLVNEQPRLAYRVNVPSSIAPRQHVIIDANTGEVLKVDDGIRYDGATTGVGPGVFGTNRTINIYRGTNLLGVSGVQYFMIDASKSMYITPVESLKGVVVTYDAKNDTSTSPYSQATMVIDPSGDSVFNDNSRLPAAVDAHYFSGIVYNYYKGHFNRNSFDNAGGSLINVVHFQVGYNNAFWNGSFMTYGDGDGSRFTSLAGALDVIAHEMTHGVIERTAGLVYEGQSGALNESYADVFGVMVDTTNWKVGEDVYTPSTAGDALRDLSNPNQGGSSLNDPGWQPANMNEYLYFPYTSDWDMGGVHINSGIPNKASYNVANAIGRAKTEQIYYRTLTQYLTNRSLFIDAREATLLAAADLHGNGSTEYNAVATAFTNVGILSNLPRTNELAYDDGSPITYVYETAANWGIANRLTAPGSSQLMSISVLYSGDAAPSGNGSFVIKVFNDNSGTPGSPAFTSSPYTPPAVTSPSWINVSVASQNISINGSFYVGIFYDGTNVPQIGADTVSNGRAWEYDPVTPQWIFLNQTSYYPATLFMRAIVNSVTGVHQIGNEIPTSIQLIQNYPNPFNPSTTIEYTIPKQSHVNLSIYDINGRLVATLVDNDQTSGYYRTSWNGINDDGSAAGSGTYIARLKVDGRVSTTKILLIK